MRSIWSGETQTLASYRRPVGRAERHSPCYRSWHLRVCSIRFSFGRWRPEVGQPCCVLLIPPGGIRSPWPSAETTPPPLSPSSKSLHALLPPPSAGPCPSPLSRIQPSPAGVGKRPHTLTHGSAVSQMRSPAANQPPRPRPGPAGRTARPGRGSAASVGPDVPTS